MSRFWKKGLALLLSAALVLGFSVSAYANEKTEDSETTDEITVDEGDKPYLALGADLSKKERQEVLSLLGITEDDLEDYDVVEITNKQEHEYLGEYIPEKTIGSRALSSVVVMEGKKGSGINVVTKNITYCTTGMYENALATAGLEDAEVIVAGPFEISGTAALLGVIEAYSVMTGDEIDEDVIDGAVNEIVTTGSLEEGTGSSDEVEGMVAYLKEQIADQDLSSDEIRAEIEDAAKQFDVSLTEEQIDQLLALLEKLQGLDLDWDKISKQAQSVYDKLKGLGLDINFDELGTDAQGFFAKIINFFKNLFKR